MMTVENGNKAQVVSIEHVWKRGLHNPQTESGTIVVNGVVASTFTQTVQPGTASALLAPLKWLGWSWNGFSEGCDSIARLLPSGGVIW